MYDEWFENLLLDITLSDKETLQKGTRGVFQSLGHDESDLGAVKDERRPAAWAGRISPKVDIAAADLSLKMPTCPSVSIDPSLNVLSPNLLPT